MTWRCQECDYLGEEIVETEETDEGCPECGGSCIEIELMTEDQESALTSFFEQNLENFIVPDGTELDPEEAYHHQLLWEDFKEACEISNREGIYSYTVVECDGEEAWLIEGWHYVNRIGYYLTNKKIDIPEEGLRYW